MEQDNRLSDNTQTMAICLTVHDADKAIEFYKRAFSAEELTRKHAPNGKIMHAELKIGDNVFFVNDEFPGMGSQSPLSLGGTTGAVQLRVDDVDTIFDRAVAVGAECVMPVDNMFWGDRFGMVKDPFGHLWGISTPLDALHHEDEEDAAGVDLSHCEDSMFIDPIR